jgi:hypothetical protein
MAKIQMSRNSSKATSDFDNLIETEVRKVTSGSVTAVDAIALARARLTARRSTLFPSQLAFLNDPSKKKAAICTRRAGKTFACRHLVAEAVVNNAWTDRSRVQPIIQYITTTRAKAVDLFWTPFKALCQEVGLDAHWDDHQLRATFPNGVLVRGGGADDKQELEKYLGDAYPLVVIDEAASFGPLIEDLVVSKLSAAMIDFDGTIAMIGTPGQSQSGMFYKVYQGVVPGWSKAHRWSYMTNTSFPEAVRTPAWIENNIGPLTSPRVQREYFGEWVTDAASLVYQTDESKIGWDGILPKGHEWRYALGVDVGFRDPCAFVVGAFAKTHPTLFIVHAGQQSHMLPTQVEAEIARLKAKYQITRIVMDTGGSMARNNMEEWNRRSAFGIMPAEKKNKYDFIEHMNGEFYLGRIKVHPSLGDLKQEWRCLVWEDADASSEGVRHDGKPKEHPGFPNHMSDAALYMFRESTHYKAKSPIAEVMPGEKDYERVQQLKAKQAAMAAAGKKGWKYGRF